MKPPVKIIQTGDGSSSLLNTALNETYHSLHGALRESLHVFIRHGLEYFVQFTAANRVRIFEVGFGTGLNALLAAQFSAANNLDIHYTSIEAFPLDREIWAALNYADNLESQELFSRLHEATWNKETQITNRFSLTKLHGSLLQTVLPRQSYDVIFFDAFAPSKQAEMWEMAVLTNVVEAMAAPGVFVTYCARGQLKRDLKALQLTVETLAGPPGKKEMVCAQKKS
jgi:tRNA U34 5-methylaminomethyl-2-thiouridine-forming methyltransferase MnmC